MGAYNTILFECPNCGQELAAQTKSGNCQLDDFCYRAVTIEDARDANRHAPFECDCGKFWMFDISPAVSGTGTLLDLKIIEFEF